MKAFVLFWVCCFFSPPQARRTRFLASILLKGWSHLGMTQLPRSDIDKAPFVVSHL